MAVEGLEPPLIRTAEPDDLPRLLDLLDELKEKATPGVAWERADPAAAADTWRRILADERRAFLVAEVDGQVVATADLIVVPNLTHGASPVAFVENVVVTASMRGRGIGSALMVELIARARAAGCYKIQFLSNKQRTQAHAFYRSLGFEATAEGFRRYI